MKTATISTLPEHKKKEFYAILELVSMMFDELGLDAFDSFIDDGKRDMLVSIRISRTKNASKIAEDKNTAPEFISDELDNFPPNFEVTGINSAKVGDAKYSWCSPTEKGGRSGWMKKDY